MAEDGVVPIETYDVLVRLGAEARTQDRERVAEGEPIPEGRRRETIFSRALGMVRDGSPRPAVLEEALRINEAQCRPRLDAAQVRAQVDGAVKHARKRPTPNEKARARAEAIRDGKEPAQEPTSAETTPEWEQPVPLGEYPTPPAFPLDALPAWLAEWSRELAAEKGASVDIAAMLGLGVVSGAIARHVQASPRPGYYEPTNLYLLGVLDPGQRKTPLFLSALRPVRGTEHARMEHWKEQSRSIQLSADVFAKRRRDIVNEAAGEDLEGDELEIRLQQISDDLGVVELSPRPRLLTEDITPEGLAQLLAEHGRIIVASDEGGALFENLAGRYAHGSTSWDVYNKAHSAADMVVDRKSSDVAIVWAPALTLILVTQGRALHDFASKRSAAGRGVLARPLYALPTPTYATGRTPQAEEHALTAYQQRVRSLYEDTPLLAVNEEGQPLPVTLKLAVDAEIVFERYERELDTERRRLGLSDDADAAVYLGWLSKLAGQTVRLAAVLHAAERWTGGITSDTTIGCETTEAAVCLARYFHEHAMAAFALIDELPHYRRARSILRWLQRREPAELKSLTVRDVHRSRGDGVTAEDVAAALRLLEAYGYVRIEPQATGKRGRPTTRVELSPLFQKNPR